MSYTAFTFIIFMIVTGLLYFLMPRRARWGVLLAASYIFYFLSSKLLLFSLLATTVSVYLSGLALGRINAQFNLAKKTVPKEEKKALRQKTASRKKLVVFLAVLFNFGLLLFFKYFNFFGDTVNSIFGLFSELSPVARWSRTGISAGSRCSSPSSRRSWRGRSGAMASWRISSMSRTAQAAPISCKAWR